MSDQGVHIKSGKVYVIRFYSKKWRQNAFYQGPKTHDPQYTKVLQECKEYKLKHNALKVAEKLTETTGVVHSTAVRF